MLTSSAIVTQARSWMKTRFHHQGRVKASNTHKGGCDCIGLVLGVAGELGIRSRDIDNPLLMHLDEKGYSRYPDGFRLQAALQQHLYEVPKERMMLGDVALFRFDENPQHVGIISHYETGYGIIHCYAQARQVVEHRLDDVWQKRLIMAYRFHGV